MKSFPKTARLLKHADFEKVYKAGKRHFSGNMTIFFLPRSSSLVVTEAGAEQGASPRVGFTVGRALGPAVIRNRIRRRLREAVREHLVQLKAPVDVVINPKKSALTVDWAQLTQEVQRAFAKIQAAREAKG